MRQRRWVKGMEFEEKDKAHSCPLAEEGSKLSRRTSEDRKCDKEVCGCECNEGRRVKESRAFSGERL